MFPKTKTFLFQLFLIIIKTSFPNNCDKIISQNPFKCEKCKQKYTLLNNDCPCYDRNCISCTSSYPGACIECKKPFILNPNEKNCICNIDHCLFCSEQGCDQCEIGYILFNGECVINDNYSCFNNKCQFCSNSKEGNCRKCYDGYNLENGICIKNPSLFYNINNDTLCPEGYYSIGNGCNINCLGAECDVRDNCINQCLKCENNVLSHKLNCKPDNYCFDNHCIYCRNSSYGFCDLCEIGYRLENGVCNQCNDEFCLNCDYSEFGECNSCINGYYLINGNCYPSNNTTDCYSNVSNCEKCFINNNTYCFECSPNYTLTNGICIECNISNCIQCSPSNQCVKCDNDYILDYENNSCQNNIGEIPNCLNYLNSECNECEKNYIINEDNKCSYTNNNLTSCTSYECMSCYNEKKRNELCKDGLLYNSINDICEQCEDPGCRICFNQIGCLMCYSGLSIVNQKCINATFINETIPNCIQYNDNGKCIDCKKNCYIKNGECICNSRIITIFVLLSALILMIVIAFILIYIKKRNEIRELQAREDERNKSIIYERELIKKHQLKQKIIDEVINEDKKLEKCNFCNSELAFYKLDCGCKLCLEHGKELNINFLKIEKKEDDKEINHKEMNVINNIEKKEDNNIEKNNQKDICPVCKKEIKYGQQISFICEICFEVTSKVFHFSCGCAMEVCKNCYNKIINSKTCPGCRKNLINCEEKKIE